MNTQHIIFRYLALLLVLFGLTLFIPTLMTAQEDIPPIPHKLEKRGDCLACHAEGKLKSPKIPEDHEGRTNEECQDCHRPVSEASAQQEIPPIPHQLENREECLECHAEGKLGATVIPDDHEGRTDDECQDCHQPISETDAKQEIPPIPHQLENREECLECHAEGKLGATVIPDNHEGRTDDECQDCHQPISESEVEPEAETPSDEADAQEEIPPIPHQLENREECLECHAEGKLGATIIPDNHEGRTDDECQDCHQPIPEAEVEPEAETPSEAEVEIPTEPEVETEAETPTEAQTETQRTFPPIPHELENREECLECHAEGEFGAPKIPEDHEGRVSAVCQDCHQLASAGGTVSGPPSMPHTLVNRENCLDCHITSEPTPAITSRPEPLPTPIIHPQAGQVDSCVECHTTLKEEQHADIVVQSQRSIHAERDVSCADCHGGDPSATTKEEAKSSGTGYIGVPAKADIPALCASCHARVTFMRQYDLPTDQYAKYQESIHGIRLAEGDENVATCFDCHGGHQILKANDPLSSVYAPNVPVMCASCHADEELMAPYNIPTNQFDLYKQSVHGHALLDNHDLRAPSCAACHGTHGAAPPGFDEVANVCGSCHSATQDYYLESPHASNDEIGPKCVTCHGRYDVSKPTEALYLGSEPRHCGACHAPDTETGQVVQSLYETISAAAQAYDEAELSIQNARSVGMLVAPLEGELRQANTDLITARAAQHSLNLESVSSLADEARATAEEVQADAEAAIAANLFRRRAMVIAVAIIALTIIALFMLKRELDRQLDANP